ncbi:MAG: homoserine O-succinyltransferase [Lachnospiraceae bacterium]|nr:homoserine O-succinyltransferase [Lachnospiraceae bacterium]
MPIKVKNGLPARENLERENIFVVDENRALHQDIRPLQVCILNLMPLKEDTELHLLRVLSNTPLQIDISFMQMSSHHSSNTSPNHLNRFYHPFTELKNNTYDGLIVTGAPVEQLPFEEVDYWQELCEVFEWSKAHVTSTYHICWGAQAGLYYHYGIRKIQLSRKLSGVYRHRVMNRKVPLARGMDDLFMMPHSRYTALDEEQVAACPDLTIIGESEIAGSVVLVSNDGKNVFVTGHSEYDRYTLDKEYRRDLDKGLAIDIPEHYYPGDNPAKKPNLSWRSTSNCLYTNWLNYYVYQNTPYQWGQILGEDGHREAAKALTETKQNVGVF